MITIDLEHLTAQQLARLYVALLAMYLSIDADTVYQAGVANCGAQAFAEEIARLVMAQR